MFFPFDLISASGNLYGEHPKHMNKGIYDRDIYNKESLEIA